MTALSGEAYEHDSGILSLVIKYFGITNTSVQKFALRIPQLKMYRSVYGKLKFCEHVSTPNDSH